MVTIQEKLNQPNFLGYFVCNSDNLSNGCSNPLSEPLKQPQIYLTKHGLNDHLNMSKITADGYNNQEKSCTNPTLWWVVLSYSSGYNNPFN